jgi:hypothetical protein
MRAGRAEKVTKRRRRGMTHVRLYVLVVLGVKRVLPNIDADKGNDVEKRVLKGCVDQSPRAGRSKGTRVRTWFLRGAFESPVLLIQSKPAPSRSLSIERNNIHLYRARKNGDRSSDSIVRIDSPLTLLKVLQRVKASVVRPLQRPIRKHASNAAHLLRRRSMFFQNSE